MKKYKVILLGIAAMIGLSACNDKLDLRSNGSIDMDQVFADYNYIRGYLNRTYSFMQGPWLNAGSYTDDAQSSYDNTTGNAFNYWYNQGLSTSNFSAFNMDGSPWDNYFQAIRQCNVFLANIDGATAPISDIERAGWKAQARTLRAFFYLQLMKRYGQFPLFTEPLSTDHDYSSDTKATIGQIATQIFEDCDAAIATSNSEEFSYIPVSGQWNIMTKAVAQVIRSETATYVVSPLLSDGTFTLAQAQEIAADALAKCLQNDYKLWNISTDNYSAYAYYFLYNPNDLRAQDKETIYGGSRATVWAGNGLPFVDGQTAAGNCPTQDLVDAYEMANGEVAITGYSDSDHLVPIINSASGYSDSDPYTGRDPRFYATVFYNGSIRNGVTVQTYNGGNAALDNSSVMNTHTGYYMRKYAADASNKNSNSDGYMRLMRLAELYYNFAEIAYQASGPDTKVTTSGLNMSARDAVNAVRARAGMPDLPSGLTASQFESRYRNDRRVEFAMEADRYFCLRRWNILTEKTAFVTGMSVANTGNNTYKYTRFRFDNRAASTSKYLLYPLSLTEAKKMQELTGTDWQNAGWE